jgi:NADH pyrophosphatase NudC (nudix superfamily)
MTDPTPLHTATLRAQVADEIDRLFAPLREAVGLLNPLAVGTFCDCGTRLDNDNAGGVAKVCPVCGEAA